MNSTKQNLSIPQLFCFKLGYVFVKLNYLSRLHLVFVRGSQVKLVGQDAGSDFSATWQWHSPHMMWRHKRYQVLHPILPCLIWTHGEPGDKATPDVVQLLILGSKKYKSTQTCLWKTRELHAYKFISSTHYLIHSSIVFSYHWLHTCCGTRSGLPDLPVVVYIYK